LTCFLGFMSQAGWGQIAPFERCGILDKDYTILALVKQKQ
jgi:hypothetical protein